MFRLRFIFSALDAATLHISSDKSVPLISIPLSARYKSTAPVPQAISTTPPSPSLFSLSVLSDEQLSIMRYLSLIPITGINKRLFARWTGETSMNTINILIELGLIKEKALNQICLHPMIREITTIDTVPSVTNCKEMLEYIHSNILIMHGLDVPYSNVLFETILNIIEVINKNDLSYYLRFLEDAFVYMDNYRYKSGMQRIVEEIDYILTDSQYVADTDRALLYDYKAILKDSYEDNIKEAIVLEEKAISCLPALDKQTALITSNLNANYGGLLHKNGNLEEASTYMKKGIEILRDYNLEHLNQMVVQICNYAALLVDMGDIDRALTVLRKCAKKIKQYYTDKCHDYAMIEETIGRIYLISGDIKASTEHRKKALSIYQEIWNEQPELIIEKYKEIETEYINAGIRFGAEITKYLSEN